MDAYEIKVDNAEGLMRVTVAKTNRNGLRRNTIDAVWAVTQEFPGVHSLHCQVTADSLDLPEDQITIR